jgi:hypothetical protein
MICPLSGIATVEIRLPLLRPPKARRQRRPKGLCSPPRLPLNPLERDSVLETQVLRNRNLLRQRLVAG